jgi:hypothetical protein
MGNTNVGKRDITERENEEARNMSLRFFDRQSSKIVIVVQDTTTFYNELVKAFPDHVDQFRVRQTDWADNIKKLDLEIGAVFVGTFDVGVEKTRVKRFISLVHSSELEPIYFGSLSNLVIKLEGLFKERRRAFIDKQNGHSDLVEKEISQNAMFIRDAPQNLICAQNITRFVISAYCLTYECVGKESFRLHELSESEGLPFQFFDILNELLWLPRVTTEVSVCAGCDYCQKRFWQPEKKKLRKKRVVV